MAFEGEIPSCSRCKRLGLTCIAESRKAPASGAEGARASARSRLGMLSRALLIDGGSAKATACAPCTESSPFTCGEAEDDNDDCNFLVARMNELSIPRELKAGAVEGVQVMLHHAITTARERDHCGLMGVAMLVAHRFGMSLHAFEKVASACPGSRQAAVLLADTRVPPCLAEVFESTSDLCLLRVISAGKVMFKPNRAWR